MMQGAKVKIKKSDWLLIIAIVLASMTEFRIWKVGPAEALAFLWCALNIKSVFDLKVKDPFFRFWALFFAVITIGSCYGNAVYPEESSINGLLTWGYFAFVSLITYAELRYRTKEQLWKMMEVASIVAAIWFFSLYLYSRMVSRYFLGAYLWFGPRFTGGASNPNQAACVYCVLAIVAIGAMLTEWTKRGERIVFVLTAICLTFLLLQTDSSTGLLALVAGILLVSYKKLQETFLRSGFVKFAVLGVCIILLVLYWDVLLGKFLQWVSSDSNGDGRWELFATYPKAFAKSPIFGLGPGTHAEMTTRYMEYHNTYLEVLAMGGIAAGVVFAVFSFRLFKTMWNTKISLAVLVTMYVFGFAGFGMRRLVYWTMLSIAYHYAVKDQTADAALISNKDC